MGGRMHDVAVIGAGPYGLSIAAHLASAKVDFRIFGEPMQTWRTAMPRGMRLKSEGFASTLYDPKGEFPFSKFCQDNGIPYARTGLPVSLENFAAYGMEFQRRYVPGLDTSQVASIAQADGGFRVTLADGREESFRRIVCAVGISHYAHMAPELSELPPSVLSHASAQPDLSAFAGKSVIVVGGGASAADTAALLADAGAEAQIVTRRPRLAFHAPPRARTWRDSIRRPVTTIGPGWKSVMCTRAPLVFHAMPRGFRHDVTRRYLGPAPCWFVREQIESKVSIRTGSHVTAARESGGAAVLDVRNDAGLDTISADHVIAATGYRVDLGRLSFLDQGLKDKIRSAEQTPILSRNFETSVPGLYFVGASSANAFGPLVRFACGAEFTARRLTRHLA